jgi:RHS repeat-associated protein
VFSIGYDFHLGAGDNGNVFAITNNKDNTRNQTFTYDPLNRLASAQNLGTDCTQTVLGGKTKYWGNSYGYDAWGNLLKKTVTKCSAENLSATALNNNQLAGYAYDAAGNVTHDTSGLTYNYDQENRITGAAGFTYRYDADGNRVEKSNGSTGTLYWYMSPGIVAESDLAGNLQSEYVFFDGERVARRDFPSGAVSYYFSDHLKTTDIVTDAQGNIKNESDFYPWGGELQFLANDFNHYKFTGKERDPETGLDYFGARYYGNAIGRFITPDWAAKPVNVPYANFGNPQSLNLYSYVKNNPTTFGDPDGHCGPCVLIIVPAAIVTVAIVVHMSHTPEGRAALNGVAHAASRASNAIGNAISSTDWSTAAPTPFIGLGNTLAYAQQQGATQNQNNSKQRPGVQPYEVGTYAELTARSKPGDGLSLDHQPSNASNLARATAAKGEPLTPAEAAAVTAQGTAVAVPNALHVSASPTFGGRNTPAQIRADAANPQAAAARDSQAMVNAASPANKAAAQAAAEQVRGRAAQLQGATF